MILRVYVNLSECIKKQKTVPNHESWDSPSDSQVFKALLEPPVPDVERPAAPECPAMDEDRGWS